MTIQLEAENASTNTDSNNMKIKLFQVCVCIIIISLCFFMFFFSSITFTQNNTFNENNTHDKNNSILECMINDIDINGTICYIKCGTIYNYYMIETEITYNNCTEYQIGSILELEHRTPESSLEYVSKTYNNNITKWVYVLTTFGIFIIAVIICLTGVVVYLGTLTHFSQDNYDV